MSVTVRSSASPLDPGDALGPVADRRRVDGALVDDVGEAAARHDLVDQAPHLGLAPVDALGLGREHVGEITPDVALVDDPRQTPGPWQDPEEGQLRERDRRRPVVDEEDAVTRERELVPTARRGTVHRSDPDLPGVVGRVLDGVARLVGELAEVHLVVMCGRGEHPDVRARAEHLVLAAREHDRADLRMLETQPLQQVSELDVDPEVVAVELEVVAGAQPTGLVDVHHDAGAMGGSSSRRQWRYRSGAVAKSITGRQSTATSTDVKLV